MTWKSIAQRNKQEIQERMKKLTNAHESELSGVSARSQMMGPPTLSGGNADPNSGGLGFFSILLTHKGSHREVYRDSIHHRSDTGRVPEEASKPLIADIQWETRG